MKHRQSIIGILLLVLSCGKGPAESVRECNGITFLPMPERQMPSMLSPRSAHGLCELNGEWTVFGGHTTGFVRDGSAEYFARGKWRRMEMLYAHDTPFVLASGDSEALVGGGYAEDFGIGQSWGVERYDARMHVFTAQPILEQKRAHASAALLEDGTVVVSGNWYAPDSTEVLGGDIAAEAPVTEGRSYPYILPFSSGQVLIFGSIDSRGAPLSACVDRLDGPSFEEPLLRQWHPFHGFERNVPSRFLETAQDTYWVPAFSESGEAGILQVKDGMFSILETAVSLPMEGPWGPLFYTGSLWAARPAGKVLLTATDGERRFYCFRLDLSTTPVRVDCTVSRPLAALPLFPRDYLLGRGLLLVAGGMNGSNYEPSAAVFLFDPLGAGFPSKKSFWPWAVILLLCVGSGLLFFLRGRTRRRPDIPVPAEATSPDLSARIAALMEERQLFRKPDLRLADLARELGTNSTYISACINGELGGSFPEYIAQLRVRYAGELMRSDPTLPLSSVSREAGFQSERSFFRTFKSLTGLTPGEWKKTEAGTES